MNALQVSIVRHTRNYDTMLAFYRDKLGMQITEQWDEPENRGTLLAFGGKVGGTVIEIIQLGNEAVPGVEPINVVLSIEVENADAAHDELIERSVPVVRGLENMPWNHRSFGIDDPDGFRIWFYQDLNSRNF